MSAPNGIPNLADVAPPSHDRLMKTCDLAHLKRRWLEGGHGPGRCSDCWNLRQCVPSDLRGERLAAFEHAIGRMVTLPAGHALVSEGQLVDTLYVLETGALKCVRADATGAGDLTAFHFPGAVLGLAEQRKSVWTYTHVTLEDSRLCRIPFEALTTPLRMRLSAMTSHAIRELYDFHVGLAQKAPSQRLGALLLQIAAALRTLSFRLPMTEGDLANYLFISRDSVGESFRTLIACGWLSYHQNDVYLRDQRGLRRYVRG